MGKHEASNACPFYEPLECTWDLDGILPRWLEGLGTRTPRLSEVEELVVLEIQQVLRARTPGQRLFFVSPR